MSEPTPVVVPQTNPNDDVAVIVRWHVDSGAWVEADQVLATIETTKAAADVMAPVSGYAFFSHAPKSTVDVGSPIAWISDRDERPAWLTGSDRTPAGVRGGLAERGSRAGSDAPAPAASDGAASEPRPRATRKALKLMHEHGFSESDFPAGARIDAADVERRVRALGRATRSAGGAPSDPRPERARETARTAVETSALAGVEPLEQSPAKILEAARLGALHREVVPSTVSLAVPEEALARRLRAVAEQFGPLSLIELAIHEVGRALKGFPELNGFFEGGRASRYASVNVGFAINLGKSLRVPVVRDADKLSPTDVARTVRELSLHYMRGELTAADVADGTFTITDLSAKQVVHFVPVLNRRQSAILAICAERPGTGSRELVLTFDHRISDGMQAADFLLALRGRLTGE
jgi:pyruvate/2-oxoglutarate dehydrogenase complex dihydrolipoamide acyltransferase (E2) component